MKKKFIVLIMAWIALVTVSSANVINIPDDYPTIQQGINASYNGDTVLVKPGVYVENISFDGHSIVLGSLFLTTGIEAFIEQTIIDGDASGTVVTFESGEDSSTMAIGFTIRNGYHTGGGAGIYLTNNSNPKIYNNIIKENVVPGNLEYGGGIFSTGSQAHIKENIIEDNFACWGGGIACYSSQLTIENNIIKNNVADP